MWNRAASDTASESMSAAFAGTLIELMGENSKIIALDADLANASGFSKIREKMPDNFIECGISEANMTGTAAGLSMFGFIPFVHSFAPFITRRVLDQIFLAGAYSGNTVNIYGSDPGVCAAANGGTHSSYEDIALLRSVPEVMIFDPADTAALSWLIKEICKLNGVHYIRASRKAVPQIYSPGSSFQIGKGNVLREGDDAVVFTSGIVVSDALKAADMLEKAGISVEVIDLFTIKPIDKKLIIERMKNKKLAAVFENHSIYGGIGSAVAEIIAENEIHIGFRRIGAEEKFGEVGSVDYLKGLFGLTAENLTNTVLAYFNKI